jgi:hypothetical protein
MSKEVKNDDFKQWYVWHLVYKPKVLLDAYQEGIRKGFASCTDKWKEVFEDKPTMQERR